MMIGRMAQKKSNIPQKIWSEGKASIAWLIPGLGVKRWIMFYSSRYARLSGSD